MIIVAYPTKLTAFKIPQAHIDAKSEKTPYAISLWTHQGDIWEPACGDGRIARVLTEHGHDVVSTDLYAYGHGLTASIPVYGHVPAFSFVGSRVAGDQRVTVPTWQTQPERPRGLRLKSTNATAQPPATPSVPQAPARSPVLGSGRGLAQPSEPQPHRRSTPRPHVWRDVRPHARFLAVALSGRSAGREG